MKYTKSQNDIVNEYIDALNENIAPLFLEKSCDFTVEYPRIIQHVDAEVFYDQPHLNHAFKRMTGLSPLEYFEANSILQDNLMAASYNEISDEEDKI